MSQQEDHINSPLLPESIFRFLVIGCCLTATKLCLGVCMFVNKPDYGTSLFELSLTLPVSESHATYTLVLQQSSTVSTYELLGIIVYQIWLNRTTTYILT